MTLFSSTFTYSQEECNINYFPESGNTGDIVTDVDPVKYGQSFRSTCNGNLNYFEFISTSTGTISSGTLNIYSGNTVTTENLIYTQSYPEITITTAGDPIAFNITGAVPLILDNQYTFECAINNVGIQFGLAAIDNYFGGNGWGDGIQASHLDFIFSNFMLNSTLGIESDNRLNSKKLYPNPSTAFINVSGLTKVEKYAVYNALGEKISNGTISDNEKIDIQNITNGFYFLKFENGNTLRFIKE